MRRGLQSANPSPANMAKSGTKVRPKRPIDILGDGELEVLKLEAQGYSRQQIANGFWWA